MIDYVELRLHTVGQTFLLPDFSTVVADTKYNDLGALELTYPLSKAKTVGLTDQSVVSLTAGFSDGTLAEIERYVIESTNDDKVSDGERLRTLSGRSTLSTLDDAVVYPSNWPVTNPPGHEFVDQNLGTIFRTLILRAKNRGALATIDETSFSGSVDSSGAAWSHVHTQNFSTGAGYYSILLDFMSRGLVDAWMESNGVLKLRNGGARGNHIGIGTVEIRPAKNTSEMTTATNSTESASTVLIEGEEGTAIEQHRSEIQTLLGRRRERYVQQGGIPDAGVLTLLANAELDLYGRIPTEETVGISNSGLTPFKDFKVADWVWVRYEATEAPVERRVRQLAVSVSENREVSLGVTLNSILYENDLALQRKIEAYAGSGGNYGSVPNSGIDNSIPQKPNSVSVTSGAYVLSNGTIATAMVVNWVGSAFNIDGTAMTDLEGYVVQWKYAPDTAWSAEYPTTATTFGYSPLTPGAQVNVRVAAVDGSGHRSDWASAAVHTLAIDAIPPPKPAAPTAFSRLGAVQINWVGQTDSGNAQPPDWSYAEVHGSTNAAFVPDPGDQTTKKGHIDRGGTLVLSDLIYNQTWYYRIICVDTSGNASVPSNVSAGVVVKALVDADVIGAVIDGAHLKDDTVKMEKLAIGDFANRLPPLLQWPATQPHINILTDTLGPVAVLTGNGTSNTHFVVGGVSTDIEVKPGEKYQFSWAAYANYSGFSGVVAPYFQWKNADGTDLSTSAGGVPSTPQGTNEYQVTNAEITVPPGAFFLRFIPYVSANMRGAIRNVTIYRKNAGELIVDGTVFARHIAALQISTDKLAANSVTTTKVAASAITADKIHVSAQGFALNDNSNFEEEETALDSNSNPVGQGRPANWTTQVYASNAVLSWDSVSPLSGTRSARVTIPANEGGRLYMSGPKQALQVTPGEKWFVSVRVKPIGGAPTGNTALTVHTATPSQWQYDVFNGNVTWQGPSGGTNDIPLANGTEYTLSGTITVPAGHNKLSASLAFGSRNAAGYYIVDDFVVHPAIDDTMVTDIGAGKLRTGLIQANVKIVAGAVVDSGARMQLTAAGLEAFNAAGSKTFELLGSTGSFFANGTVVVGPTNDINISLSAYGAGWGPGAGGPAQGMIRFSKPGQGDGNIFSQYWYDQGDNNAYGQGAYFAALRLQSPLRDGGGGSPAILDLRHTELGRSRAHLEAEQVNFTANTFIMGGPANTVDFRLGGAANGFTFSDFSATSRLNLYADAGQFRLRAGNNGGGTNRMMLNASDLHFLVGGAEMYVNNNVVPGIRHFNQNIGWGFQNSRVVVATWAHNLHMPIEASLFAVNSDPRWKKNAEVVSSKGALNAIKALNVYDYKMKGASPKVAKPLPLGPWREGESFPIEEEWARGVMADEVRKVLPEAVHEDDKGYLSVSLYDLLATTMAALQESDARTDKLEIQISELMKGKKK